MADSLEATYRPVLEAIAFAARAHQGQLRKDRQTPYVSHVFRVCLILRQVFGVEDLRCLQAAALHDTIEDTTTDYDDLAEHFGAEVADWVTVLTKDKRLAEPEREKAYEDGLARAPWQVKVCKLADVFDNLMDAKHLPADRQPKPWKNAHRYLASLKRDLPPEARRPWEIVNQLLAELEPKFV